MKYCLDWEDLGDILKSYLNVPEDTTFQSEYHAGHRKLQLPVPLSICLLFHHLIAKLHSTDKLVMTTKTPGSITLFGSETIRKIYLNPVDRASALCKSAARYNIDCWQVTRD